MFVCISVYHRHNLRNILIIFLTSGSEVFQLLKKIYYHHMLIRVIFISTHPNLLIKRSGRWISISRFETILTHTQPLNYQIKENMPRNLHKSSTKSMFINSHIFIVIASVWLDFTKSFYLNLWQYVTPRERGTRGARGLGSDSRELRLILHR